MEFGLRMGRTSLQGKAVRITETLPFSLPASFIALVHIITPRARSYKGITSSPTCLFHLSFTYSNAHQSFAVPESAMGSHCLRTLLSLANIP